MLFFKAGNLSFFLVGSLSFVSGEGESACCVVLTLGTLIKLALDVLSWAYTNRAMLQTFIEFEFDVFLLYAEHILLLSLIQASTLPSSTAAVIFAIGALAGGKIQIVTVSTRAIQRLVGTRHWEKGPPVFACDLPVGNVSSCL